MASGFDFYLAATGILLDHGLHISSFLPYVEILSVHARSCRNYEAGRVLDWS